MVKSRTRPLAAKDFPIIRILKRAMMQALDEDTMPLPVADWPLQSSKPLPPIGPGDHAYSASSVSYASTMHFLDPEYDETTRISSLRSWLLAQPDIVKRIDNGVDQEFGEASRHLRRRAMFLHILFTAGGITFGIIVGLAMAVLLHIGH